MSDSLYHHGIRGQKWGVRRFQNPDGSLTARGKKRVSAEYKKEASAVTDDLMRNQQRLYVNAHNRAAISENKKIAEAMARGERDTMSREEWDKKWTDSFNKTAAKYLHEEIANFVDNNEHQKRCKELVKKYGMLEWNDLAKENATAIDYLHKPKE